VSTVSVIPMLLTALVRHPRRYRLIAGLVLLKAIGFLPVSVRCFDQSRDCDGIHNGSCQSFGADRLFSEMLSPGHLLSPHLTIQVESISIVPSLSPDA